MDKTDRPTHDAAAVAERLAAALQEAGQPYALGGAIALGYWGAPRGTLDVDVTVFLPPDRPSECLWLLQDLGCEMDTAAALGTCVPQVASGISVEFPEPGNQLGRRHREAN
ncbi:MAG: hypothetical protein MUF25_22140 [Pirellulaceae bacterium]|nr:hypothetical protein [Pirellulaceae bacterium]